MRQAISYFTVLVAFLLLALYANQNQTINTSKDSADRHTLNEDDRTLPYLDHVTGVKVISRRTEHAGHTTITLGQDEARDIAELFQIEDRISRNNRATREEIVLKNGAVLRSVKFCIFNETYRLEFTTPDQNITLSVCFGCDDFSVENANLPQLGLLNIDHEISEKIEAYLEQQYKISSRSPD
ncbi:MAG: hypothetical protein ACRBCK_01975 [Alphaproteobacteria bacterium]